MPPFAVLITMCSISTNHEVFQVITGYLLAGSIIGPGGFRFISEMVQVSCFHFSCKASEIKPTMLIYFDDSILYPKTYLICSPMLLVSNYDNPLRYIKRNKLCSCIFFLG